MASPAASAETDPTKVSVDPQNPLPESNWGYRRAMVFVGLGIFSAMLAVIIWQISKLGANNPLSAINALTYIAYCLIALLALDRGLYLVAPSAEQFANWMQTVSAWKSGISFQSKSTAETAQGRVTSEQMSGKADAFVEALPTMHQAAPDGVNQEVPPWER